MVTKARQKKLRSLITEAVRHLSKDVLESDFMEELTVEGLLGITLDNQDVLLVNINETFYRETEDDEDETPRHLQPQQRRSLRSTPAQMHTAPNTSPRQIQQPPRMTPQSQQRATAMKRKLESTSPAQPAKRQTPIAQPTRATRSTAAAQSEPEPETEAKDMQLEVQPITQETEYEIQNDGIVQQEPIIEHISATDATATTQEIELIETLEEKASIRKVLPQAPAAGSTTKSLDVSSGATASPEPITIVPRPKPGNLTMRSNGHRGLQPVHVSIPAPIHAVHIEQLFTDLEEDMLVDHMHHFYDIGWGLINTTTPISLIGSNFANFLKKTGSTTPHVPLYAKWYRDLKLHKPAINMYEIRQISAGSKEDPDDIGQIVSTEQIQLYYQRLSEKMRELDLSKRPFDIWMMEETQCEIFTNLNEKEVVTVIGCFSCTGEVKPPMLTFKGKKQVTAGWTDGATQGTKAFVSTSGISSSAIVQKILSCYFRTYSDQSGSGYPENPVLVLYDPRKGNVCPGVIEWAESKGIVLFPFPPHFESLLEPLEPGCVTPFKSAYEAELADLAAENATFIAHKHNVCAIICKVFDRDVTGKSVVDAFIKLGIQVSKTPKPKAK